MSDEADIVKIADAIQDPSSKTPEKARPALPEALGQLFEDYGVKLAICAFEFPGQEDPGVFFVGHFYDAARLNALVARRMRTQIKDDLG